MVCMTIAAAGPRHRGWAGKTPSGDAALDDIAEAGRAAGESTRA